MNSSDIQVMTDLETESTRSNARIIQIGAAKFLPFRGGPEGPEILDTFKVNVVSTTGHVCNDTLKWWEDQKREHPSLEEDLSTPEPIDLMEALIRYKRFCKGAVNQWSNGSNFDCVILDNHYIDQDIRNPFPFWSCRDTRTLWDLFDPNKNYRTEARRLVKGNAHDALVDCKMQIHAVQRCLNDFAGMGI